MLFACKSKKLAENSSQTNSTKEVGISKNLKTKYAEKLGVNTNEINNQKLYSFIDDWYGVPYKYAGKDKKGIDCSGLTSTLYLNVYQKSISSNTKALVNEVKQIKKSDLKEGDLVFFKIDSDKVSHVGVYLQNQKFVHASTKKGVMISDLNEPFFQKTYHSSGRVK
jgi:lipoprotein Spr